MAFGPPVGFTPQGDMTPFTQFTPTGDWVRLQTNSQGDVVPWDVVHAVDGPFTFDANGNRIPGVEELYGQQLHGQQQHQHVVGSGSATTGADALTLLLLL